MGGISSPGAGSVRRGRILQLGWWRMGRGCGNFVLTNVETLCEW